MLRFANVMALLTSIKEEIEKVLNIMKDILTAKSYNMTINL